VKYGKIDVKKCFVSDIETDFVIDRERRNNGNKKKVIIQW